MVVVDSWDGLAELFHRVHHVVTEHLKKGKVSGMSIKMSHLQIERVYMKYICQKRPVLRHYIDSRLLYFSVSMTLSKSISFLTLLGSLTSMNCMRQVNSLPIRGSSIEVPSNRSLVYSSLIAISVCSFFSLGFLKFYSESYFLCLS